MAINAPEIPVLNDASHIKSCQSKSTQPSVISGLTSAFWSCFIRMAGVPGHPIITVAHSRRGHKERTELPKSVCADSGVS